MRREAHVPIVLWIVAAAAAHWAWNEPSKQLVEAHHGREKLQKLTTELVVDEARKNDKPLEIDLAPNPLDQPPADLATPKPQEPETPPPSDPQKPEEKPKEPEKQLQKQPEPPKPPPPKVADKQDNPAPKTEAVVIPVPAPTPPPAAPPPPPPPAPDKKIAVIQNQNQDEAPNPDAKYLAEKNHKVDPKDESHATITSTTQNDENPTPGTSNNSKPSETIGNGDKDQVAQSDDHKGAKVAPNVVPKEAVGTKDPKTLKSTPKEGTANGDDKKEGPKEKPSIAAKNDAPKPNPTGEKIAPTPATPPEKAATPTPGAPNLVAGNDGSFNAPPALSAAPKSNASPGTAPAPKEAMIPKLPTPGTGSQKKWVSGLDGAGASGLGKLALNEENIKATVGMDQLDRLKNLDAETKASKKKGQFKTSSLEKWRAAIENYTPGVRLGNQTNLGTAAAPWATYLAQIHVRLHPIFADSFVDSLDDLPSGNPLNDKSLVTRMEIVLKPDGTIDHLGIVRTSGVTAFDVAALDSVDRAAPFGKAPTQIVSPDGLVYLHWEFHRDDMRCSNVNAYPYLLKEGATPKAPEPIPTPNPPKVNPEEEKKTGALHTSPTQG